MVSQLTPTLCHPKSSVSYPPKSRKKPRSPTTNRETVKLFLLIANQQIPSKLHTFSIKNLPQAQKNSCINHSK